MRRLRISSLLVAIAIAAAAVFSGCGGEDDSPDEAGSPPATGTAPERPQGGRGQERSGGGERAKERGKESTEAESRRLETRERREDRKDDKAFEKFDEDFEETPFEKLIAKLPVRKPPLFVEQYITTEGSHKVYTAVDEKRFLCELTPRQRKAAVSAFNRSANRVFRGAGVKDFVQVVTPLAETTEELPALAIARNGSVSITVRGRGAGPC